MVGALLFDSFLWKHIFKQKSSTQIKKEKHNKEVNFLLS